MSIETFRENVGRTRYASTQLEIAYLVTLKILCKYRMCVKYCPELLMLSNGGNIAKSVNIYQIDSIFFSFSNMNTYITNKLMFRHIYERRSKSVRNRISKNVMYDVEDVNVF